MPKALYIIPNGPKNLSVLFPGIDFTDVAEYYVQVLDVDNEIIGTSTLNKTGCCCTADKVRIHFMNYLGTFDAINFGEIEIVQPNTSSQYRKSLKVPLEKTDSGIERFNVRANEAYTCKTTCYGEKQMQWCMELFESPKVYMEWKGIQGQDDQFIPIVVEDMKPVKKKLEERYTYELILQFKLSNEKIIIRN